MLTIVSQAPGLALFFAGLDLSYIIGHFQYYTSFTPWGFALILFALRPIDGTAIRWACTIIALTHEQNDLEALAWD